MTVSVLLGIVWLLLASPAFAGHGTGGSMLVTPSEYAKRLLDEGNAPTFIDLRSAEEFKTSRLPRARSIPLTEFQQRYREVPARGRVVLYCACPEEKIREAYQVLRDQGYRNISVMIDGFDGWIKRGYALERN